MMSPNTENLSVLIADDHPIFCDGLRALLQKIKPGSVQVLGIVHNGAEVLQFVEHTLPDLVLMDIQMPQMDGIQATSALIQKHPSVGVIALSSFDNLWAVSDMLTAGARGYLLKNTTKEELGTALHAVHQGGTYFTPTVQKHLAALLQAPKEAHWQDLLTGREIEVIRLLCQGRSNKEIAAALFISKRTVEGHRGNIMTKLNVHHPIELYNYAVRHGIYKVES